ncbi:MAG: hypothetical protein LBR88_10375 [Zoogloeaceae bacterium]|jgi:hypothetical protein|nr:hypothetical protein [Zoogloeaceae bacterium]
MIIWQGWGFLVALIFLAVAFILFPFFNRPDMAEYQQFADPAFFLINALLTLLLGLYLRRKGAKVFIDEATGKEVVIRPRHTLFFIPVLFWAAIFAGMSLWFLVREPPPKAIKGELIRPLGYFCDSEEGMKSAIAAISATEQPVNYDQLPESDRLVRLERLALLKTLEGCGVIDESSLPVRLESRETRQEEHAGRNWHVARIYFQEIKGESLKLSEQIQPVWLFHRHETEEDAFIQLEDGKKW